MSPFLSNVRNAHSKSAIPSPRGGPESSKQSACRDQSRPEMDSRLAQTKWSRNKTKARIPELPSHFFNPRPRKKSQSAVGAFEVDRSLRRTMLIAVGAAVSVPLHRLGSLAASPPERPTPRSAL